MISKEEAIESLKPCPFCGGEAVILAGFEEHIWIFCEECNAEISACTTEAEAIEAWNKRVDRPEPYNVEAVVKKLESRILKSTIGIYAADVHNNAIEDAIRIVKEGAENESC